MSRWWRAPKTRSKRRRTEISKRDGKASAAALDVTDIDAVRAFVGKAEPFDILVNNAGSNRPALFIDVTVEDFDAIFKLNVRSAFFVAQAVVKRLVEAKKPGSIIHISSQMGHVGGATPHRLLRDARPRSKG